MTQSTTFQPTPATHPSHTCADCDHFGDFGDDRKRGWCAVFDRMARAHHERTTTCDVTIRRQSQQKNRLTAMVRLVTHELDIDPEEGFTFPKNEVVIEVTVTELTKKAVERVIEPLDEFRGYYVAGFWQPEDDEF